MERFPHCPALDMDEGLDLLKHGHTTLSPAQLVDLCAFLRDCGVRARELARILDCPVYQISHHVRIGYRLHPEIKQLLHRGLLSLGHCRAIARLPGDRQVFAARTAIARKQSVRDLEKALGNTDSRLSQDDLQYYRNLGERIGEVIGHPVSIRPDPADRHAGSITIRYTDSAMFDAICDRLQVDLQDLI
jgi:hypothetical protein